MRRGRYATNDFSLCSSQNAIATGSLTDASSTKTCTTGPDTADTVWTAPATGTGRTANGVGITTTRGRATRTVRRANATKSVSVTAGDTATTFLLARRRQIMC